jgi:hypothetical protein
MTYAVTAYLSDNDIYNQFVTAFEGGSNYWVDFVNPISEVPPGNVVWWGRPAFWEGEFAFEIEYEGDRKTITRADVAKGVELLPPTVVADILLDEGDADTADQFLQYVVLGDVVFG